MLSTRTAHLFREFENSKYITGVVSTISEKDGKVSFLTETIGHAFVENRINTQSSQWVYQGQMIQFKFNIKIDNQNKNGKIIFKIKYDQGHTENISSIRVSALQSTGLCFFIISNWNYILLFR